MSKVFDLTTHHIVWHADNVCVKTNLGVGKNLTSFYFTDMDHFLKFDMVVSEPPQLTMWYNDLDGDHRRTLNKYVGALTELINMNGWPELIEVLTGYWDSQKMVFLFQNSWNFPDAGRNKGLYKHRRHWDREKSPKTRGRFHPQQTFRREYCRLVWINKRLRLLLPGFPRGVQRSLYSIWTREFLRHVK